MPNFGKNKVKDAYIDILKYVKSKNCKVIHVKFKDKDLGGTFSPETNIICIDKRLKYTITGCFVLLHEYAHSEQNKLRKYDEFMSFTCSEEYSDRKLLLIIEAEVNASKKAVELLRRKWNIRYISEDSTKNGLKECIKYWKKFYFK